MAAFSHCSCISAVVTNLQLIALHESAVATVKAENAVGTDSSAMLVVDGVSSTLLSTKTIQDVV